MPASAPPGSSQSKTMNSSPQIIKKQNNIGNGYKDQKCFQFASYVEIQERIQKETKNLRSSLNSIGSPPSNFYSQRLSVFEKVEQEMKAALPSLRKHNHLESQRRIQEAEYNRAQNRAEAFIIQAQKRNHRLLNRRGISRDLVNINPVLLNKHQIQNYDQELKDVVTQNLMISQPQIKKRSEAFNFRRNGNVEEQVADTSILISPQIQSFKDESHHIPQIKIHIKPKLEISIIADSFKSLHSLDKDEYQKRRDTSSSGFQTPLGPKLANASEKILSKIPISYHHESRLLSNVRVGNHNASLIDVFNDRKQQVCVIKDLSACNQNFFNNQRPKPNIFFQERRRFSQI
ncbi:UNKNOWN [Stylonychia lemnae]|uniref:Uncharacterized protein n=1 Tax=Stylonychia lemnae TaxID=5949 RepID=A0A077ZSW2_STYLE|nr:UNKNOWN [Stylonychia lemnae]|eukprot:CDW72973.1 UNKNOWN [Stylonychia lemnae]